MQCEELANIRSYAMAGLENVMPPAMKNEFARMSQEKRTSFILTGMNCEYTAEWDKLYDKISEAVHTIYCERKRLYEVED